jgi:hypothetical protein
MPVAQLSHAAASSAGFVVWHLSQHRQERRTYGKERKKGARVKTTLPPILSTIERKVTRRTITGPNASHSLKAAESLSSCPHTRQRVKALLGASRGLSALISATYGSQPQKPAKRNPYKEFLHNCPPSINQANFETIITIVHNSELLKIVTNCYKMLRIVTKNQLLRIVTKCYEMLQNVKNCNNSTFVLQYACTNENDSHYQ